MLAAEASMLCCLYKIVHAHYWALHRKHGDRGEGDGPRPKDTVVPCMAVLQRMQHLASGMFAQTLIRNYKRLCMCVYQTTSGTMVAAEARTNHECAVSPDYRFPQKSRKL